MIQPSIVTMSSVHMNRSGMMYTSKDHVIGVVLFCLLGKVLGVLGIQYFITICSFDKPSKNKGNRILKEAFVAIYLVYHFFQLNFFHTKKFNKPKSDLFIRLNCLRRI